MTAARIAIGLAMLVISGLHGRSQDQTLKFEVASVKVHQPGDPFSSMDSRGDRFVAINNALETLLHEAYKVPPGQRVKGIPSSLTSVRFDINAKTDGPAVEDVKRLMLQILLEDRFKVRMRRETVEGDVYALVMARADGRPGPNLQRASAECERLLDVVEADTSPGPADDPAAVERCWAISGGFNPFRARGVKLETLVSILSSRTSQVVVDRTALTGRFDFELRATVGDLMGITLSTAADTPDRPPSILTALPEQLGLKLERQRGPIETFVLEHAEMPTPD